MFGRWSTTAGGGVRGGHSSASRLWESACVALAATASPSYVGYTTISSDMSAMGPFSAAWAPRARMDGWMDGRRHGRERGGGFRSWECVIMRWRMIDRLGSQGTPPSPSPSLTSPPHLRSLYEYDGSCARLLRSVRSQEGTWFLSMSRTVYALLNQLSVGGHIMYKYYIFSVLCNF